MKEMTLPFRLSIVLTQTDVHWVEAQLLEQRTKLFLEALHQVLAHIEGEVVPRATACERCGGRLVRNGQVPLVLETLLGRVDYARSDCGAGGAARTCTRWMRRWGCCRGVGVRWECGSGRCGRRWK